ncbi:YcxB family protein [Saccharophagus degradans]|uniref:YcxB family protein n=1 Tax=Saccharophagus degradans TaxID=86304 RepID=UPI002477ED01|nr:YcxB family protein [Saccharophagus degradans]WGO98118.1 YcxB family protein [Saccharophagus degradans]
MEFEINLGNLDITKAIIYAQARNKVIWAMCVVPSLLINGISVVGLWAMGWPLQDSISVAGDFLIWIFGLFFVGLALTILSLVANPKWRKGRIGRHKIEINKKGIVESTEYNRSEIYWPSIRKISKKASGIYFIHSGADSFVIPRSSFKSPESWDEFESFFFAQYEQSKNA